MTPENAPIQLDQVLERIVCDGGTGNFIIFRDPKTEYYVQVAASKGDTMMHLEAVSNEFIESDPLDAEQEQVLFDLGWIRPSKDIPNYYQDLACGRPAERKDIMSIIIATFKDAYEVPFDRVEITVTLE